MLDRYAVLGNPIHHSLSPTIHGLFAAQTGEQLQYDAIAVTAEKFNACIFELQSQRVKGLNITLPFKEKAYQLAHVHSVAAQQAGAVNTIVFKHNNIIAGHNTDGIGLIQDLSCRLQLFLPKMHILILGAGGAARGILPALLQQKPQKITLTNRSHERALTLAQQFKPLGNIEVLAWQTTTTQTYDLIINTTALDTAISALPAYKLSTHGGCYDLNYGAVAQPFLTWAKNQHAAWCENGLGMLVEQAAAAFFIWRGLQVQTQPVLDFLINNSLVY